MSEILFKVYEIEQLKANPYVKHVSEKAITYTDAFKTRFLDEYHAGKSPSQVFRESGFDVRTLGEQRIKSASNRWREAEMRTEGTKDIRKGNTGRKPTKHLSDAELIAKMKIEIETLKQEREFLLELRKLERQVKRQDAAQSKKSSKSSGE
ncbi:MAG: hypothetical protein A2Y16_00300 [Tenericutes bacterium GWF2_57_13]|nr:MAG: hypothetical protein A2Y16_00300 [Tenericutes bacterium GWF2_57_13]